MAHQDLTPEASVGQPPWRFTNRFTHELPADPSDDNRPRQVPEAAFSRVQPTPVRAPRIIASSREMAATLDLTPDDLASPVLAEVLGGNRVLSGMDPFAACYGGHQFGNWAGQLGDGRAIALGEVETSRGERWELQLKGAGPTPYSRFADGRAVLRSSVREFLCSEAMHHLGVPTTRALSLVMTGDLVERDMFYDGRPEHEPGAVVCRVAPSFLRFGNFEIFASRGDLENLRRLADFAVGHYFPAIEGEGPPAYIKMLETVCRTTAVMVAEWMRVGFVHGVMNTDNMSLLGLTIDYGPYGWLEPYDPVWTPNTTDASGRRYAYGRQPEIAGWNLVRFAEALYPIVGDKKALEDALDVYTDTLNAAQAEQMAAKLGLVELGPRDGQLVQKCFKLLRRTETDMTIFFRGLGDVATGIEDLGAADDGQLTEPVREAYYNLDEFDRGHRAATASWMRSYISRLREDDRPDAERRAAMHRANPKYVLRNYMAQLAIDQAADGDPSLIAELLEVLRRPYDEQPDRSQWAARRPEWARHKAGCSMLSCSS
ncbi:MAG: YdiU family protein [Acidobacteriota bacterium]